MEGEGGVEHMRGSDGGWSAVGGGKYGRGLGRADASG